MGRAIRGKHLILEFYNCKNEKEINEECFKEAIEFTGAEVLKVVSYNFRPQGKSILILLSESHASMHSYPEYNLVYLDIFTCGDMDLYKFRDLLKDYFKPDYIKEVYLDRDYYN